MRPLGEHRRDAAPADLTIRRSSDEDRPALARLAQLEGAPAPDGEQLVAEEGGELRAAISLDGGTVIADPFQRTADLVAALRLRADRLRDPWPVERRGGLLGRLRRRRPSAAPGELAAGGVDVPPAGQADGRLHAALR